MSFEEIRALLEMSYLGISLLQVLLFLLFLAVVKIASSVFFGVLLQRWKVAATKTKIPFDDFAVEFVEKMRLPTTLLLVLLGLRFFLPLSEKWQGIVETSVFFLLLFVGVLFIFRLVDFGSQVLAKKAGVPDFPVLTKIAKILVAGFSFVLALSNVGINVTSLVAGLGIGGIAVALAAQNVLRDLFASVSISLDRPFSVGDFVTFGDVVGNVTHIGIKSTRIKTLQGEEVSVPNAQLTDTNIHNYAKLSRRRVNFSVGVAYDTPVEKIKRAKEIVREAIEARENADFGRCFFWEFAESALNFDIVYFVNSGDYDEYLSIQEEIGFDILDNFSKEKIEIAFPTRTVWVKKD